VSALPIALPIEAHNCFCLGCSFGVTRRKTPTTVLVDGVVR
jgi:hypothetical protein